LPARKRLDFSGKFERDRHWNRPVIVSFLETFPRLTRLPCGGKAGRGVRLFRAVPAVNPMKNQRPNISAGMKNHGRFIFSLLLVTLVAGCATPSTVQSRIQERTAAYQAFSPAVRQMVDAGRIEAGMNEDAVYIAWGKPDEVLHSGDQRGEFTTWVYRSAFLEETRYWAGRRYPHLAHDYEPRSYVRAEIVFFNGNVQSWRTLPQPAY
jgi:hypothetical protein